MVGAFRVERLIGVGSLGAVYEATQPSLGRTVALRLIGAQDLPTPEQREQFDDQQRRLASLNHPNLVGFYGAGEWEEGGRFIATRFIRGARLSDLQEEGLSLPPNALEAIAAALHAAHSAGLVHGRISADNVLVEANGTAYLADLGLGHDGTAEGDLEALAGVVAEFESRSRLQSGRRRLRRLGVALAVALAIAIPALVVALDGGEDSAPTTAGPAPAPPPRTSSIGSPLPPGETTPLGCIENPTPNTALCTIAQTRLDGTPIVAPRDGVVRGWAVRGASGDVSLQVIRERDGRSFLVGFSEPERISDPGPHAFPTDISLAAGDGIGVGLGPGATIGSRAGGANAEISRWDGRLTADRRAPSEVVEGVELMIRADIEFRIR